MADQLLCVIRRHARPDQGRVVSLPQGVRGEPAGPTPAAPMLREGRSAKRCWSKRPAFQGRPPLSVARARGLIPARADVSRRNASTTRLTLNPSCVDVCLGRQGNEQPYSVGVVFLLLNGEGVAPVDPSAASSAGGCACVSGRAPLRTGELPGIVLWPRRRCILRPVCPGLDQS